MKKYIILSILIFSLGALVSCNTTSQNSSDQTEIMASAILENSNANIIRTINIVMVDGQYIETTDPGPYGDHYWQGHCVIQLVEEDELIYSYDLEDDWKEPFIFTDKFILFTEDYDEDDQYEFLLGQYLSSNMNTYKLYRITSDNRIELVEGGSDINISGSPRYSCSFDIEDIGGYSYNFYDNINGQTIKKMVRFIDNLIEITSSDL